MSTRVSHCTDYAQSEALRFIYSALYGSGFEAFCAQRYPKTALRINTDFSERALDKTPARRQILRGEPDLPLRQLLYYVRPAADFRAFSQAVETLATAIKTLNPAEKTRIPWQSLLHTAQSIDRLIQKQQRSDPTGSVFTGFTVNQRKFNQNPMLHKGNTSYPLYAQLFNDPLPPSTSLTDELARFETHQRLTRRLWIYTLIRTYERRTEACFTPKDQDAASPYRFLNINVRHIPDLSRQSEIERLVRTTLSEVDTGFWQWAGTLMAGGYADFCAASRALLTRDLEAEPPSGRVTLKTLTKFLDFFAHERRSANHHHGGGTGGAHHYPPGHYLWRPPRQWLSTEDDATGDTHSVHQLRAIETLIEQDVGGDDESLTQESLLVEILYGNQDAISELKLEQHTSHSQLLLATHQQPLWWHQSTLSHERVLQFLRYLDDQRSLNERLNLPFKVNATLLLHMMVILGLDLEGALQVEAAERMPQEWLTGSTHYAIGETDLLSARPVRIVPIEKMPAPVWVIPIPVRALGQRANSYQVSTYVPHRSSVAFTDRSPVGNALLRRSLPRYRPSPVRPAAPARAVFAGHEQADIRLAVTALLTDFNAMHHETLSLDGLRRFGLSLLLRAGASPKVVDLLDPNVPITRRAMLHYFCWPLAQPMGPPTSAIRQTLPEMLSYRTALGEPTPKPIAAPLNPLPYAIGAAGLPQPAVIKDLLQRLQGAIDLTNKRIDDLSGLEQAINVWNATTLYVALAFLLGTGHRPHHHLIIPWQKIDPLHGTAVFTDKTDDQGTKARIGFIPSAVRSLLRQYAQAATTLKSWARQNGFEVTGNALVMIHYRDQAPLSIRPFRASALTAALDQWSPGTAGLEANFARRLIPYLLRLEVASLDEPHLGTALNNTPPVSENDLNLWLGHWQQGTAPFHLFSTASVLSSFERIAPRLEAALAYLEVTERAILWPSIAPKVTAALIDAERKRPA